MDKKENNSFNTLIIAGLVLILPLGILLLLIFTYYAVKTDQEKHDK